MRDLTCISRRGKVSYKDTVGFVRWAWLVFYCIFVVYFECHQCESICVFVLFGWRILVLRWCAEITDVWNFEESEVIGVSPWSGYLPFHCTKELGSLNPQCRQSGGLSEFKYFRIVPANWYLDFNEFQKQRESAIYYTHDLVSLKGRAVFQSPPLHCFSTTETSLPLGGSVYLV
jgi:hypothetical protein